MGQVLSANYYPAERPATRRRAVSRVLALRRARSAIARSGRLAGVLGVLVASTCIVCQGVFAQDATWVGGNVGDPNEWVEPNNWTGGTVPTGTATFTNTGVTTVANDAGIVIIGAIDFTGTPNAQAYTINIDNTFIVNGVGVTNNSTNTQTFNITDGNSLIFQNSSTANNGTGAVTYDNAFFITFENTSNAGNGNTTVTNNEIVQFFDNSSAGSAHITNNIEIDFFDSSTAANATITNNATGTLTFNSSSTAESAVITNNGGTILFNNSSAAGSANITNDSGATLTFNDTSTAANAIIINNNLGATTFGTTGSTATAGNATITDNSGGTTTFNAMTTAGASTITNDSGGSLVFNDSSNGGTATIGNSGTMTFNNTSSAGAATITNTGAGTLTFNDTSTAGSAGITNLAIMTFSDTASAGSANIDNEGPSGSITFNNTSTTGSAAITNGGSLTFNDTSAAATSVIVSSGLITFNNSSTAGAATITTIVGGTTKFLASSTGGNARFITNAGGIFDMSGLTDGGMTAGSIEGAGNYFLGGNALTVGSNNLSTTVTGLISDGGSGGGAGGSLIKVGTGTLTLTDTEAYTGATTIDGGALNINGSIALSSGVAINSGGTLEGTGVVSSTMVNSGGMLSPGTPGVPGTSMSIAGNLAFQSGALYVIYLNPSSTTMANVSGTASLAGTVEAFFAPGSYASKSYDILHSGGLGGTTFSGLTTVPNFDASLSYTATDVFLNLVAELGQGTSLNVNQQNVANAINTYFNSGGALPPGFMSLFGLSGTALANALTQLDGEDATGAERGAFQLMDEFLGLMLDPFAYGRGGSASGGPALDFAPGEQAELPPDIALAYAGLLKAPPKQAFDRRWIAWGAGFGGSNRADGDPVIGSTDVTTSTYGYAGGMDYHYSPDTVLGFALAGGGTHWGLANALGTGRSDAVLAGVYGATHQGPAYLAAALAFANNWFTTDRTALGDQLTAKFEGQSYGGRLEGGYRLPVPSDHGRVGIAPYAAIQAQDFHTPSYSETDLSGGGFGLSYKDMNGTDTRSELGARFDDLTALGAMPLMLRAAAAWAHDWVSNPALNAGFESLPGASFTVFGAPIPHNSALTSAGAQLFFTPNWSLLAKFDGEFASGSQTFAGSGTLRHTW